MTITLPGPAFVLILVGLTMLGYIPPLAVFFHRRFTRWAHERLRRHFAKKWVEGFRGDIEITESQRDRMEALWPGPEVKLNSGELIRQANEILHEDKYQRFCKECNKTWDIRKDDHSYCDGGMTCTAL